MFRVSRRIPHPLPRREFLKAASTAALAAGAWAATSRTAPAASQQTAEAYVKELYHTLSADQKQKVCFAWEYVDPKRGLLRTRIAANWRVTEPPIKGGFFTPAQQGLIRKIFESLTQPGWHERFDRQLKDDDDGFGTAQTIAIFGDPGQGKYQFVLTGRHMTLRSDGGSEAHMAFGGPVFYGHAASGFHEKPGHPGNIFWPQGMAANGVFEMLDADQRREALVPKAPRENLVPFQGPAGKFPGVAIAHMTAAQQAQVKRVLDLLVEPYRDSDRDKVRACLQAAGGIERCSVAFYQQDALAKEGIWDLWRLEGPAFVWYFRGAPHVHTWVNVGDDPGIKLNA